MENNTWGKAVVETALLYAEHEWYPTDKNVMHGVDEMVDMWILPILLGKVKC